MFNYFHYVVLHPIVMGSMLLYSISTAILGFQWRRQRTLGDEISALKKTLPAPPAEGEAPSPAALEIEAQVNALTQERKDLAAAGPRDKHFSQGAWLAFVGTAFAIEVRPIVDRIEYFLLMYMRSDRVLTHHLSIHTQYKRAH